MHFYNKITLAAMPKHTAPLTLGKGTVAFSWMTFNVEGTSWIYHRVHSVDGDRITVVMAKMLEFLVVFY